jgi:hypothetical protein
MKDSKALYGFWDGEDCCGVIWETELGKIVTVKGNLNPQMNLEIRSVDGNDCEDVDLRNVLMQILDKKFSPIK